MNTAEQLASAWAAVEGSGVPDHLHEVAFKAALSLEGVVLGGQALRPPAPHTAAPKIVQPAADAVGDEPVSTTTADLFYKFAHETGIDQEALEDVFYFHEGLPGFNVPARRLGSSRADQARAVTLALTAAYHFVLGENEDRVAAVRKECERLKCLDTPNFTKHLASTKGVNFTGPRTARVLRTKNDTISELKELIAFVRGAED